MSKTVDDLVRDYDAAEEDVLRGSIDGESFIELMQRAQRAGIAAVIRALRPKLVLWFHAIEQNVTEKTAAKFADDFICEILGDAGNEKVAEDPLPHLSEREKALFVAALKGDAGPTTPPATDPAPAVCVWEYRLCPADITIGSVETACGLSLTGSMFRPKFNATACDCGRPVKLTEAK